MIDAMPAKPSILYLYLNDKPRDRVQELIWSGIRRYVSARGWQAVAWQDARPEAMAEFLKAHRPVAGCVVECSDDNGTLPPRIFGRIPVAYLHAAPSLYGGRGLRVVTDNAAVARLAFRELSAGRPEAYAFVGDYRGFSWSRVRGRAFRALAVAAGAKCILFRHVADRVERAARLKKWVAALPRRTAIFAANDFAAADVIAAAQATRRAIPQDITLIGVDNNPAICEGSSPKITSIQLDHERAGYLAAKVVGHATRDMRHAEMSRESAPCVSNVACRLSQEIMSTLLVSPILAVRRESTGGSGRHEPHVLAAVETIRREACDGLTARDVIDRAPGSKSLFNLRFREAMGHSVHDEIEYVRFEKVFTLLAQTDTAIGAIADMCGYRSNIALHKAFRLRTGMSMSAWRAQNRR